MRPIIDGNGLSRSAYSGDQYNGAAIFKVNGVALRVIFSNGMGWEHVSVSLRHRCPTWDEMCAVKERFFEPDECVMQLHPPRSDYVNFHPHCLHLWRPLEAEIPRPIAALV